MTLLGAYLNLRYYSLHISEVFVQRELWGMGNCHPCITANVAPSSRRHASFLPYSALEPENSSLAGFNLRSAGLDSASGLFPNSKKTSALEISGHQ